MKILQEGAISRLYNQPSDSSFRPLLQIIDCHLVEVSRYSLVLSDGSYSCRCLASPGLSARIEAGELRVLTVGNVTSYGKTTELGSSVIIINDFAMLLTPSEREGNPKDIECGSSPIAAVEKEEPKPAREESFTPIRTLTTFNSDWIIKARVTKRGDIKEWNNPRGSGKLFNVTLMDSLGDEISAAFFNQGADKFYPVLTENGVYTFSKGQVKVANKKFSTVMCEYQLCFDKNAEITEVHDDGSIDNLRFNLVTLDRLGELARRNGALVDVCAVVKEVGELSEFTSKRGDHLKKRVLILADPTNHTVELTLWNEEAESPVLDETGPPLVLLAKSLKMSEFNSLSLGTDKYATKLIFNPRGVKVAENIIQWRDTYYNPKHSMTPLSVRLTATKQREHRTIRSINEELTAVTDANFSEVFIVRAHVNLLKYDNTQLWYASCCNVDKCKKKMTREGDSFRCDSCSQVFPACVYRYVASMKICDETDGLWLSVFDEKFEEVVGVPAKELKEMLDRCEDDFKDRVTSCLNQRFEFTVRAGVQDMGQGPRPKFSAMAITQIDPRQMTKALIQDLETMLSIKESRGKREG